MNRRNFLSRLPLLAATPLLLGSKHTIHTGEVYWSPEDIDKFDNYDPNVIERWKIIWMWVHDPHHRTSISGDSVNIRFCLEYSYYENPKDYFPKLKKSYEGDKTHIMKYMHYNYNHCDERINIYAKRAMDNFIKTHRRTS